MNGLQSFRGSARTKEIIEKAMASPREWLNISDQFNRRATAATALHQYVGRWYTPLDVAFRGDEIYVRWNGEPQERKEKSA